MRRRFLISSLVLAAALAACAQTTQTAPVSETSSGDVFAEKPESWFLEQVGGRRLNVDGQTLDVRIQYLMDRQRATESTEDEGEPAELSPEALNGLRQGFDRQWTEQTRLPPEIESAEDITIETRGGRTTSARVYRPRSDEPLPILVYFHGGGYMFGTINAVDRAARLIAHEADVIVVSADYRLAPEDPYPAAWDDAEDTFAWVAANAARLGGDPSKVCVGGDSAGGNFSLAVTARRARAGQALPHCQALYYAAVDNRNVPTMRANYLSARLFGVGFWLEYTFTDYVLPRTFPGQDLASPEISPLLASDWSFAPPTLMFVSGFDPLRDQQRAFAARLREEGVELRYHEFSSLIHGFQQLTAITPEAYRAARLSAREIGRMAHDEH